MSTRPGPFESLDRLALSNTVTLSALVAVLTRNGVLDATELTAEIQALRARLDSQVETAVGDAAVADPAVDDAGEPLEEDDEP